MGDHVVVGKATLGVTFSASTERTNVTCVAIVGDIYKSATSATLTVVDLRFRTTTIRPPSHLHAASGSAFIISDFSNKKHLIMELIRIFKSFHFSFYLSFIY